MPAIPAAPAWMQEGAFSLVIPPRASTGIATLWLRRVDVDALRRAVAGFDAVWKMGLKTAKSAPSAAAMAEFFERVGGDADHESAAG